MKRVLILSTQTKDANTGVQIYCDTLESVLSEFQDVCVQTNVRRILGI